MWGSVRAEPQQSISRFPGQVEPKDISKLTKVVDRIFRITGRRGVYKSPDIKEPTVCIARLEVGQRISELLGICLHLVYKFDPGLILHFFALPLGPTSTGLFFG